MTSDAAWVVIKWLDQHVRTAHRNQFEQHFGEYGRAGYRDVVPGTPIRMHTIRIPNQHADKRVYLLFTGVETIEEFKTAIAWLQMQDRLDIWALYT